MFQTSPKKLFKNIFLALVIFSSISFSQTTRSSFKILGIAVEGNKSADASTIIANSGLKVNDEIQIPGDQTLNAIKQLWSLNIFSDIQIAIDKQIQDGVFLKIIVKEQPRFEKLVIEGNDELSTTDIENKAGFIRGQIIKSADISRLRQRILKNYATDGYLNAQVDPLIYRFFTADTTKKGINVIWHNEKDLSDEYTTEYAFGDITYSNLIEKIKDRVLLKLKIKENEKVTVREIHFINNTAFNDGDLKGTMDDIEEAKWWKFWSGAKFDKEKFEKDKKNIKDFYLKNGYRDAELTNDSLAYYNDNKDLKIYITVYEGPQYKLRNIIWQGNTVFPSEVLTERLDFKKGDIFNFEKFERNLRQNEKQNDISSLYLDNGYLTFNLKTTEQKIEPDSIDLIIRMEEKNQFKVGRVDISGNDKTKDKVIRRELYTVPGDFFNRGLLFRSVQQLANLQFFNSEKLYGPQGIDYNLDNDSTVNVAFHVEEKSSDYLNASVGYSGSFGFSGSVGVTLTNFAMSDPFSLGGGQILSFNWQFGVGNVYRTFTLGFTEPWTFDTPTLVGVELFDTRQQYIYDLSQAGGTIKVGRRLKWPDDFFYIQGLFRYQYNDVLDGQGYYAVGKSNQYTLGATISRKDIDNPTFPSKGSSVSLDAELSGKPILPGDVSYYKLGFKAEWYKRLFNSNRVALYTVSNIGYLQELDKASETKVNPFEYYYMGGNGLVIATEPLRGYDDRTVGPQNSTGTVIGGRVMARFTTEFRVAVALEPIPVYLLTFAEAGNVFEKFSNTDIFNLRKSAGVGARLLINPIGLIGFDLGYGFDRKAVDGKDPAWLFHFQFGKGF
jgi:outer membrane protein insertion porin family